MSDIIKTIAGMALIGTQSYLKAKEKAQRSNSVYNEQNTAEETRPLVYGRDENGNKHPLYIEDPEERRAHYVEYVKKLKDKYVLNGLEEMEENEKCDGFEYEVLYAEAQRRGIK